MREGEAKVACVVFCYFFVGVKWFEKTLYDHTKKAKNSTTT
jgi:hypothetical protein